LPRLSPTTISQWRASMEPQDILNFWFEELDEKITIRFADPYKTAAKGELFEWRFF
jgi:uncharacterized protein (DUF924 family)